MLLEDILNLLSEAREKEEVEKKKIYVTSEALAKKLSCHPTTIYSAVRRIEKKFNVKIETIIVVADASKKPTKRMHAYRVIQNERKS